MLVDKEPGTDGVSTIGGLGQLGVLSAAANGSNPENLHDDKDGRRAARKLVLTQLVACTAVLTVHLSNGLCMGYSSSLIAALEDKDTEIPITPDQSAWLASSFALSIPVGSIVAISLNNVLGRVTLVKLMAIPNWLGWILIATGNSVDQILIGRILTGASIGLIHSPSMLFITEVASKSVRGGLAASATAMASIGIVVGYVMGAYMHWRTHAWACCAVPLFSLILQFILATESPVWLRARGRDEAAAKASQYYYNDPNLVLSAPSDKSKQADYTMWKQCMLLFTNPRGYKPLLIIVTMFILQQVVGIYSTIFYAVGFMAGTGSSVDPYEATIAIGVVRLIGCVVVSCIMTSFGRRPLMIVSAIGMTVTMAVSGYATMRIRQEPGSMSSLWVVVSILLYIFMGCLGWQTIPWAMMGELFPHEVRSFSQAFNTIVVYLLMFFFLQLYPTIDRLVGGSDGVQFMFAGFSAFSVIFLLLFLPETRGRSLPEIEDYFRHNTLFCTEKRRRRAKRRMQAQNALTDNNPAACPRRSEGSER